ncbi:folylpolyglutamate synthase, partial [Ascosphaera atra]
SHGKAVGELLDILIPSGSGDNVAAVEFGAVDGMPWVKACDSGVIIEHVHGIPGIGKYRNFGKDVQGALEWAAQTAGDQEPMVVAGSLYLMGDVLRRLRQAKVKGDGEEEVD